MQLRLKFDFVYHPVRAPGRAGWSILLLTFLYLARWYKGVLVHIVIGPTLEHYVPLALRAQLSLTSFYTGTATAINHEALPRRGTLPPRPHLKTFAAVTSSVLYSISA